MRRERDLTHQMKNRQEPEQSGKPVMVPPVPAAAWARIRSSDPSPTIAPYQCSKLNPEMEMTVRLEKKKDKDTKQATDPFYYFFYWHIVEFSIRKPAFSGPTKLQKCQAERYAE